LICEARSEPLKYGFVAGATGGDFFLQATKEGSRRPGLYGGEALRKSNLGKIVPVGPAYFTVIFLIPQISMHRQRPPSFSTNYKPAPTGEVEG
jgi:hypothetical protein